MILIQTLFHGWKEVPKERALSWAHTIWCGSVALNESQKIQVINSRLQGIQFTKEDLLNGKICK